MICQSLLRHNRREKNGWLNLLCAAMLSYALGRIHGMKVALEKERSLHE
jgi:hypothetical protein